MKVLIIFGPPGVGKGTQAKLLADDLKYAHVSTGQILRTEIEKRSELGNKVDALIKSGHLVSDEIILPIIDSYIDEHKSEIGIIFDGFPRTLKQAELLNQILEKRKIKEIRVVNLVADNDELLGRLIKRAQLEGREDDKPEVIKNRLKVYETQTAPVLGFYKKEGKVIDLNGIGEIDKIHGDIVHALN
jgi:adenylate kinase